MLWLPGGRGVAALHSFVSRFLTSLPGGGCLARIRAFLQLLNVKAAAWLQTSPLALSPVFPTGLLAQPNALTPPFLQLFACPVWPFNGPLYIGNPHLANLPLPVHIQPTHPSEPVLKSHLLQEAFLTIPASSPPGLSLLPFMGPSHG